MIERFDPDVEKPNATYEAFRQHHLGLYQLAVDFLRTRFLPSEDPLVIDAACGIGYGWDFLGEITSNYLGLDCDEKAVSDARRRRPHADYNVADLESYDTFANLRGVDVFCSFETAEHLYDPAIFLQRAAGVVRPGGLLLFSAPTCKTRDFDPYHRRDWSAIQWSEWLERTGWGVISTREFSFTTPFLDFCRIVPTTFGQKLAIVGRALRHGYLARRFWEWIVCGRFSWSSQFFACERG